MSVRCGLNSLPPSRALLAAATLLGLACSPVEGPPTVNEAEAFVAAAEEELYDLQVAAERAGWVQQTHITEDTEILAAQASERYIEAAVRLAGESTRFAELEVPEELARKLRMLKLELTLPAPDNPSDREELTRIAAAMESTYGRGEYCPSPGDCRDLGELSRVMAVSRDPEELLDAWSGWRTISPPMRGGYERFAELGNRGAQGLGFADLGAMWRSKYDMPAQAFREEMERLWGQVRPMYEALHCYVRSRLGEHYGTDLVPPDRPIPAHLLGNMWAQSWVNIYPLVAPPASDPGFDLTRRLEEAGYDPLEMVRSGERFFTSLGFQPLPQTFWQRSLFTQPPDRDVVCHASAWNIDLKDDLRIKMCIEVNAEDFATVHHELGHNFYQRAYGGLDFLLRGSAHDGFHEGLGDTISLSVTPTYLVDIGLLNEEPAASRDLELLLQSALDKVAFLPFGLLVDQWRWAVFSGEVPPEEYNRAWWRLRESLQGVAAPVARSEENFDPGAKYHVPANTPYSRYFLAHILQFQLHRALCEAAGYEGPLHRCSIYGSPEAGERLARMMEMGKSRPWPDALEAVGAGREMDATAIQDYYAPLKDWLDEQNRGRSCGW